MNRKEGAWMKSEKRGSNTGRMVSVFYDRLVPRSRGGRIRETHSQDATLSTWHAEDLVKSAFLYIVRMSRVDAP